MAIELLRRKGHDVLAISESTPSICDEEVMLLAEDEGRILLTGELAYSSKPRLSCGIILFRINIYSPSTLFFLSPASRAAASLPSTLATASMASR